MSLKPEPTEERTLTLTRLLAAPRTLVFKAWTEPAHLTKWWGPKNFTLPVCQTDFRVGGAYRFCMRAPDGRNHWVWGLYQEIVEPERLVFTWEREDEPGLRFKSSMVVTVTFAEQAGQTTRLTLQQSTFQTAADCDDHNGGWNECLDRLADWTSRAH